MKKIGVFLLILFVLITAFYAVLQGPLGRNFIRDQIIQAVQNSGYTITIERLEGTLPHQIDLKDVEIQGEGIDVVRIKRIQLRLVLWRLLKKELSFKEVHAKEISISEGSSFDFDGRMRIGEKKAVLTGRLLESWVKLTFYRLQRSVNISAQHPLFNLKARASLNQNFQPLFLDVQLHSDQLLKELPYPFQGRVLLSSHIVNKEGAYQAHILWKILNFQGKEDIQGEGDAVLEGESLKGELSAAGFGKASFDLKLGSQFQGSAAIELSNLYLLHIPNLYGSLKADAYFENGAQAFSIEVQSSDLHYESLDLEKVELAALKGEKLWTFSLRSEGNWEKPFQLDTRGTWEDSTLTLSALSAVYGKIPLTLVGSTQVTYSSKTLMIPPTELSIEGGSMLFSLHRDHGDSDGSLRASNIPLSLFSFHEKHIDLEVTLKERNELLEGTFNASIASTANLKGSFNKDSLLFSLTSEDPQVRIDLLLPIHLSIFPFDVKILWSKKAKGDLYYDGKVEEVLDSFNLGTHRLTGDCHLDLHFKNTLSRPLVSGKIAFENGVYENYYTGTTLKQISAKFLAEKNTLFLQELKATDDPGSGTFEASGQIDLLALSHYPFQMRTRFTNLKFLQIDLVEASAEGDILIEGNALSSIAKGKVLVTSSELFIPDHIPKPLPNLQVVYRNPTHPIIPSQEEKKPYPLFLDLAVSAPQISIAGRGLDSKWAGDFHLGGTYTALSTQGNLNLLEGAFNFSSRSFRLTEGSLSFSGKEHQMPHLNLSGTMQVKGVTIIATLHGALDDPQITLQSSPPLPLGSIMSYLLFGQDISEIGGFQALQIASSLASLVGTSPDVMENTRRSLGVDRLRIMTDDNADSVSLQVGKYVSEGVLVSFTQGTDESSANISVEIELKNNLVFQIESDQRQEQGRFTLKWSLNY